jgi:nucleotide-binding universal stress UspA family protein
MSSQNTRPVVVGVDGRPGSAGALRYAVAEAATRNAPLHLVHVMPSVPLAPLLPLAPLPASWPAEVTELRAVATSILHNARKTALQLAPGLDVHSELGQGSRGAALVGAAVGAQLVVVGRETRHGLERMLTGATTAGVAARASCDVVVVPSFWTDNHRSGRIVAGIKTQSQAHQLLGEAFAEASARGATLTLVTAWELPDPYMDRIEVRTHAEDWEAEGRQVIENLLSEWRTAYPDVPVDIRIVHGHPATVLLEASRESDLLFVCRRRHAVHAHGHLGGVAYTLLRASDVPVQVVAATASEEPAPDLQLEAVGQPLK